MTKGRAYSLGLEALAKALAWAPLLAGSVLLIAVGSPQSPPTALGLAEPQTYTSVWTARVGPANVFEVGTLGLATLWLCRQLGRCPGDLRISAFDGLVVASAGALGLLALVAVVREIPDRFFAFDIERLLIPLAGYAIVTRFFETAKAIRVLALAIAVVLVLRAFELVLIHGLLGSTRFGTSTGREALLITEDSLLVMFPVILAWGRLVDGRVRRRTGRLAVLALTAAAVLVNLLSLRRGALLFLGGALAARSLAVPPRRLGAVLLSGALLAGLLYLGGPLRPAVDDARYAVSSILFQRADASTNQRQAELVNFIDNMDGADWLIGNGLGSTWQAYEVGPIELGSFGSDETPFERIGWHVYGLDWAYKFGVAGLLVILTASAVFIRKVGHSVRSDNAPLTGELWSIALCVPVFGLFAFSNSRIGLLAGICLGICSRLIDSAGRAGAPRPGVRP